MEGLGANKRRGGVPGHERGQPEVSRIEIGVAPKKVVSAP